MKKLDIQITLTAPMLGTVPGNDEIAKEYIVDNVIKNNTVKEAMQKADEEVQTLPKIDPDDELSKGTTFFHRDEANKPFVYSYIMKGFFKSACDTQIDTGCFTKEELKVLKLTRYSYKSTINKLIYVGPRRLMLENCPQELPFVERPLRAETMRGDRVCLARSEAAPEGTVIRCQIETLNDKLLDTIKYWLDLGAKFGGLGQWRSSHYGSFIWEEVTF